MAPLVGETLFSTVLSSNLSLSLSSLESLLRRHGALQELPPPPPPSSQALLPELQRNKDTGVLALRGGPSTLSRTTTKNVLLEFSVKCVMLLLT